MSVADTSRRQERQPLRLDLLSPIEHSTDRIGAFV
jgi:hypothetical protein